MNGKMLEKYTSLFAADQIKYIFLEDLIADIDGTMKDVFKFLKVDDQFIIPEKDDKNFYYDRKAYRSLIKIIGIKPARRIAQLMPENLKNIFKQKKSQVKKKLHLEDHDRKKLIEIFKPDIVHLEKLTGRQLNHWYK